MPNALLLLISMIEPLKLGFSILRVSMKTETWEAQVTRFAIRTGTLGPLSLGDAARRCRRAPLTRLIKIIVIDIYGNYYSVLHMVVKPNTVYGGRAFLKSFVTASTPPSVGTQRRNEINLL
jgi:hypothetical protein